MSEPRGMVVVVGATKERLGFGESMILVNPAPATVPNGTPVNLPAGAALTLSACNPKPKLYEGIFSKTRYGPSELVRLPYPVKDLNFTSRGAYAAYNWELFYHVPMTIAIHLSRNQRFEEAQ